MKEEQIVQVLSYQILDIIMLRILNRKLEINLFQADICIKESYEKYALKSYDTIIIRDVIEHIEDKELALTNIFNLLKPGGNCLCLSLQNIVHMRVINKQYQAFW